MTKIILFSILSHKDARKQAGTGRTTGWTQRCLGVAMGSLLSIAALAGPAHDKLPMTGIADLWQLRHEVYIGALYLPAAVKTPEDVLSIDGPKRMELRITAEKLSPRQWSEIWNQAININNAGKDDLKGITDDVIAFTGLLKESLTNGDRITIDYTPKAGVDITLDGTVLYKSRNDRLFNALVRAWVGSRPPSSDFKRNIVILPTDAESKDLIDRYSVVLPEDSRKAEIATWVKGDSKVAEKTKPEPKPEKSEPKVAAVPVPAPAPKLVIPPPPPTPATPSVAAAKPTPAPTPTPPVATAKPAPAPAAPAPQPKPAEVAKTTPPPTPPAPAAVAAAPAAAPAAASDDAARLDGVRNIYRANMLRLTYRHVIYPASALSKNQEGTVIMKVTVNRAGKVLDIGQEKLSEFTALNKAAEKAVKKASPFPAVPAQLTGDKFEFSIPIKFRIPT